MSSYKSIANQEKSIFNSRKLSCPLKEQWISFQLVDENGNGQPYAGLGYSLQDSAEQLYLGVLDEQGSAKIHDCYRGPAILKFNNQYVGSDDTYCFLMVRPH